MEPQNLYSPNKPGKLPRTKTGFKNSTTARKTLKNIQKMNKNYQKQVVITMYNRAKYHPHQNAKMKEAMQIYYRWMKQNGIIINQTRQNKNIKKQTRLNQTIKKSN